MKNAWLIYDREGAERNRDYIEYHHEVGARYDITFNFVYAEDVPTALSQIEKSDTEAQHQRGAHVYPDFAIVRTIDPELNTMLEKNRIPTYNNSKVSRITNHKYHCIEYIKQNTTVPTIPSTLLTGNDTPRYPDIIRSLTDRVGDVIKPVSGHGGAGVMRIQESGISENEIKEYLLSGGLVLQPFIDGPGEDIRVYVIGKRIIGAVRRHAMGDEFRANASLGGHIERYTLSEKEIDYVKQIIQCFDFGMVGIDFIIDNNNQFIFNEIEDVVGARMLYKTHPEIDILDNYIRYIITQIKSKDPE